MNSHEVQPTRVSFKSEGIPVVAHLYRPAAGGAAGGKLPAVIVDGPLGSVKEQVSGRYAQRLAAEGFLTLAMDHRHFGESGGEPRQQENPADKTDDLKNAISYLAGLPEVDANRIALCGVCMGAAYTLQVAAFDRRVKALALIAGSIDLAGAVQAMLGQDNLVGYLKTLNSSRQRQFETGETQYMPAVAPNNQPAVLFGEAPYSYWGTARSYTPNWQNKLSLVSMENSLAFNPTPAAAFLSPTPVLVVHGEQDGMCPLVYARRVYDLAGEPRQFVQLPSKDHFDFYDQEPYVGQSVAAAAAWFRKYL